MEIHAVINTVDLDRLCLSARVGVALAKIDGDYDNIRWALDQVCVLVEKFPERELPFLDDSPALVNVVAASRLYFRRVQNHLMDLEIRRRYVESLPSAAELYQQAISAGESFDFAGYTLWWDSSANGWSLTNAYGIDNCGVLQTVSDFESLLSAERHGKEIGPIPHGVEVVDGHEEWLQEFLFALHKTAENMAEPKSLPLIH